VWKNNQDIPGISKNAEAFDPTNSNAICYRPMGRKKLEEELAGLDNPLGKKQDKHLDLLFGTVEEVVRRHRPGSSGIAQAGGGSIAVAVAGEEQDPTAPAGEDASGNSSAGSKDANPDGGNTDPAARSSGSSPTSVGVKKSADDIAAEADGAVFVNFAKEVVSPRAQPKATTIVQEFEGISFVSADKKPMRSQSLQPGCQCSHSVIYASLLRHTTFGLCEPSHSTTAPLIHSHIHPTSHAVL